MPESNGLKEGPDGPLSCGPLPVLVLPVSPVLPVSCALPLCLNMAIAAFGVESTPLMMAPAINDSPTFLIRFSYGSLP